MSSPASSYLFTNFAVVWLASTVTAGQTTITLEAGEGALFPLPTAGRFFMAVLEDGRTGAREVVRVTGRTSDTLTVVRAQEGTSAQEFLPYSSLSGRLTAGALADLFAPKPVGLVIPFAGKVPSERARFRLPYATTFPAGAAGSYATALVAAASSTVFTVSREPAGGGAPSVLATATWSPGSTEGVVVIATTVEAQQGDWIDASAPSTEDASLADISLTLAGFRP